MKILSYGVSLFYLFLIVQAWRFLWDIYFLLPIGILLAMLAIFMMVLVTAEDRKRARLDRIFNKMCDHYDERTVRCGNGGSHDA